MIVRKIDIEAACQLIDFSGGRESLGNISKEQLRGAVALHNILVEKKYAYLADEVGMGKTYTAIGTAALFKLLNPGFRILYIAPRQNLQEKWQKEILNFTRKNWRHEDNIIKTYEGLPAFRLTLCRSLIDFVR